MYAGADESTLLRALVGPEAAAGLSSSLSDLLEADDDALKSLGLEALERARLMACAEVARRYQPSAKPNFRVSTPLQAMSHLGEIRARDREVLAVLLLDNRLGFKDLQIIAEGGITNVSVEARDVFAPAIKTGTAALVLAHNHPCGSVEPSTEDCVFTTTMAEAGRLLGIRVVDHLIVSRRNFYSFREAGTLEP